MNDEYDAALKVLGFKVLAAIEERCGPLETVREKVEETNGIDPVIGEFLDSLKTRQ